MDLRLARVYDPPGQDDGFRVLVDRVWPRGIRKEDAKADVWLKEAGPSTELRKWFGHDPERFDEFARRYRTELEGGAALAELREIVAEHPVVTLLYGAKDTEHNQAVVLADVLRG